MSKSTVYLIPTVLDENGYQAISPATLPAIQACTVFFVENERTTRRYFKKLWKEMVIDDYSWYTIHKSEDAVRNTFRQCLQQGKTIGIVSEAGVPGVADPGQILIGIAQEANARIVPVTGPSSILLSLMASGLNGQQFRFLGYQPIEEPKRSQAIKEMEQDSRQKKATQIFIETPYRNNQLLNSLLKNCQPSTLLCIATNITGTDEWIKTKTITAWKKDLPDLHKKQVIFLLLAV